jgi:hypothetical protein
MADEGVGVLLQVGLDGGGRLLNGCALGNLEVPALVVSALGLDLKSRECGSGRRQVGELMRSW